MHSNPLKEHRRVLSRLLNRREIGWDGVWCHHVLSPCLRHHWWESMRMVETTKRRPGAITSEISHCLSSRFWCDEALGDTRPTSRGGLVHEKPLLRLGLVSAAD